MPTKKKNTKKYELSRSAIVERIADILENLEGIDTTDESPAAVEMTINGVMADLQCLQDDVTDEAY